MANDSYSVASGGIVRAAWPVLIAAPTWLASEPTGKWIAAPNSTPSAAAGLVPAVTTPGMGNIAGITDAWGGAYAIASRLGIHGGGHGDYGGNEIGSIDLAAESPAWDLLIERTPYADLIGGSPYYNDGRPTSIHTYYGLWSIGNRMVRVSPHAGFAYNGDTPGGDTTADVRTTNIDVFNEDTGAWETPGTWGVAPAAFGSETTQCQHPVTGDIYAVSDAGVIHKWTASTKTVAQVADMPGVDGEGAAAVFDHVNNRLVRFAGRADHKCSYWDAALNTKVVPTLTGPDASDITALSGSNHGWGVAHDTVNNVAYLLTNAAVLYRIDLTTFAVTKITPTGATAAAPTNGCWGRLKYLPALHCIAYLASWTSPVLVMRCE